MVYHKRVRIGGEMAGKRTRGEREAVEVGGWKSIATRQWHQIRG